MKHKEEKKIQFGGWNKRPYSEVRRKLSLMVNEEEEPRARRHKRKKVCRFNKGNHEFVEFKKWESMFGLGVLVHCICKHCGKSKYN